MADETKEVIQIPAFTPKNPEFWFCILESKFVVEGINRQSAKYNQLIPHLDAHTAVLVCDLIIKEPSTNPYTTLKEEIIKRLSLLQDKKLKSLIRDVEPGDRKPSQFLQYLRIKGGQAATDERLRKIWLSKLPTVTQAILTSQTDLSLDKVAELADSISDHLVKTESKTANRDENTSELQNMVVRTMEGIAEIKEEIHKLNSGNVLSVPFSSSTQPSTEHSISSISESNTLCWYHTKFGINAYNCLQPCSFPSPSSNNST